MAQQRYKDGRLILSQNESFVTNERGVRLRRVETILEDGITMTDDYPVHESFPPPYHPQGSAPSEYDVEAEIPFVHAEVVQDNPPSANSEGTFHGDGRYNGSGGMPTNNGLSQPQHHQVPVAQGPPQPPPQAYSPTTTYGRDDHSGACVACGWSALVCFLLFCCCCVLPLVAFPVLWVTNWKDVEFDDNFFNDDFW